MGKYNPAEVAAAWEKGLAGAGEKYKRGIMATSVNPMEKAKEAAPRMVENLAESVESGRYARGCDSVTKAQWQQAAMDKGAGRLLTGARAAVPKVAAYANAAKSVYDQIENSVKPMPSNTEGERVEKMLANMRMMSQLKGVGKGR